MRCITSMLNSNKRSKITTQTDTRTDIDQTRLFAAEAIGCLSYLIFSLLILAFRIIDQCTSFEGVSKLLGAWRVEKV
jgi:hypothetical protein